MKKVYCLIFAFLINQTFVYSTPQTLYTQVYEIVADNYFDTDGSIDNMKSWENRYNNKLNTYEDSYTAIESFISAITDGYTTFLRPENNKRLHKIIAREYDGYGLIINASRKCKISPIKNSPAEKAGIVDNDILLKINNIHVSTKDSNEIAELIDNIDPKPLNLEIKRGKEIKYYKIEKGTIIDSSIYLTPPFNTKIPDNIGYFNITSFDDKNVSKEFYTLMKKHSDKSAYIIDLRDNGGGVVKYSAEIANMLLKNTTIFTMINAKGYQKIYNANEHLLTDKPVVLLVNKQTASASEILTGALKDNKRAIVVGRQTFGKGIVQKRFDVENGCGLTVTVDKYLTPNGEFIHKKGIAPDIKVKMTKVDMLMHNDRQLKRALKIINKNH